MIIFGYLPVQVTWTFSVREEAQCLYMPIFYFLQAALGLATDIATTTPLPFLRKLKISVREKIGRVCDSDIRRFVSRENQRQVRDPESPMTNFSSFKGLLREHGSIILFVLNIRRLHP